MRNNVKQSTDTKPTINELIMALQLLSKHPCDTYDQREESKSNPVYIAATKVLDRNEKYLDSLDFASYNRENLINVMDHISANGIDHFNMTSFFGVIDKADRAEMFRDYGYIDVSKMRTSPYKESGLLNKTTKSFNCTSVGCIAGYASAIALNWNDSKVAGMDGRINMHRGWEHLACNYLNIPLGVGSLIFFAEEGSLWSFLKAESPDFSNLEYTDDTQYNFEEERIDEDAWHSISIDLESINHKTAVAALSMIVENEISFENNSRYWFPVWVKSN